MQNYFLTKIGQEFPINTVTANDQSYTSIAKIKNTNRLISVWNSYGADGSYWGIYGQLLDYKGNKIGNEFLINTYTASTQYMPCVTELNNGFMVFWSSYGQDGSGYGVYYQKYDQNAYKISIEKQLNTFTSGDQGYVNLAYEISGRPRAVSTSDDKVIVTWVSNGQDGSAGGVYFSILDSNGNKIVQESLVNTYINDWQMLPQIQVFSNNNFVISWASLNQDGSGWGIFMQRFDSSGNKIGIEMWVPSYVIGDQVVSSIAELHGDRFVVVWDAYGEIGNGYEIKAQVFSKSGNKIGSDFFINSYINSDQKIPVVKSFLNGNFFIAAWQSYSQDGSYYGIYGRVFDKEGDSVSSEFKINTFSYGDQAFCDIVIVDDSNYADIQLMITWHSPQDGSGTGIFAQSLSIDMSDFISNDISRNLFSEVISSFNTTLHDLQNKLNNEKLNCVEVKEELDVLKKEYNASITALIEEYISIEHTLETASISCIDNSNSDISND